MFFGLITKRELDQLREDLTRDVRKGQAFQQEIEYEWAKWFDKFRSLYARLLKREQKSAQDAPGDTNGEPDASKQPRRQLDFPHSRRGF